jgi:hypothetical protein
MNRYFDNFQLIRYNNSLAINITERVALLNKVFGDNYAFYPYQVKNGLRADQVADRYYGDSDFTWLVYFSNNIIDPYHQWTKDEETFLAHIESEYGSVDAARAKIVKYRVNWYEDARELALIQYDSLPWYEKKYWTPEYDVNNRPTAYRRKEIDFVAVAQDGDGNVSLSIPVAEQQYWTPVTALDVEEEENAKKAHIRLLDNRLAGVAASNLRDLLKA